MRAVHACPAHTLRSNAPLLEGGPEACFQRATGSIWVRMNCCPFVRLASCLLLTYRLECPPPHPALPMRKVARSRAWKATGFRCPPVVPCCLITTSRPIHSFCGSDSLGDPLLSSSCARSDGWLRIITLQGRRRRPLCRLLSRPLALHLT
jgi:hypothetical protein